MALPENERMRYFNEFVFASVFRNMNSKKYSDNERVLMVSEGRDMRRRMIESLPRIMREEYGQGVVIPKSVVDGKDFGNARPSVMKTVLREVFGSEFAPTDEEFNGFIRDFSEYTGIRSNAVSDVEFRGRRIIPLSPFDSRFEYRQTFRTLGSRMGYVDWDEFDKLDDNAKIRTFDDKDKLYEVGNAKTRADRSGLTMLQRYMTKADYQKCVPWMQNLSDDEYMDEAMLARSCAILDFLNERGISYEIQPDTKPGQLKAVCGTKGISVRIVDTKENQHYIGRTYQDGRAIYFNTNRQEMVGNNKRQMPYLNPTPYDCQRLVGFALGYPSWRDDKPRQVRDVSTGEMVNNPDKKLIGATSQRKGARGIVWNEAFISKNKAFSAVLKSLPEEYGNVKDYEKVMIYVESPRNENRAYIDQKDVNPASFLHESVESARSTFRELFDVDGLMKAHEQGMEPTFSQDDHIAVIQKQYWDVLNNGSTVLSRPGGEEVDAGYYGTPEEMVRQHLNDSVDYYVGNYELNSNNEWDGISKFNPMVVARYMVSGRGEFANSKELAQAARDLHMQPTDFIDSGNHSTSLWCDKMVYFDKDKAVPLNSIDNPTAKAAYTVIVQTLAMSGATVAPKDILMDEHGIVHFSGTRSLGQQSSKTPDIPFSGEIGQIFLPDEDGLVKMDFASSDNYYSAPGYRAHILPQKPGENLSMEERTRLHGYTQELCDQIRQNLSSAMRTSVDNVGSPTELNQTYRRLYDTRFSLDFRERAELERMDETLLKDIISTASRRVQYGDEIKEGSTIHADYEFNKPGTAYGADFMGDNDNFKDPYILTGRRNMMQLTAEHEGYYDLSATGTGTNQGGVRYLTADSKVTSQGVIVRGSMDGKTPLMYNDVCQFLEHVPFDRRQMTFNNLMSAQCVTSPVRTAQMTFGGWTFDDGYVVSKNFADSYKVQGTNGEMRPLMIGDKISDMNGNKGVISLVVDPDMSMEDAMSRNLEKEVQFFKNNPGLDVVGAPFSPPSRFNGGTAREMMQNPHDAVDLDGNTRQGCIGEAKFIITHMSVDEKTHMYTDDELRQGKGRRVSGQLAWALASQGCHSIMRECYGGNDSSIKNYREYLNAMGLDISESGQLREGYIPHEGEYRRVFEFPELKYMEVGNSRRVDRKAMKDEFLSQISSEGGVMELPFQLTFPTGEKIPGMHDTSIHETSWALPILSSRLRTGQSSFDDVTSMHDYTRWYSSIFDKAIDYKVAQSRKPQDTDGMAKAQAQAQAEYDKITNSLKSRVFSGKHNFVKESIMSVRMPNSATAVWTADPRLDLDQVAMGKDMAEIMGVKDEDSVLIWRDPMLRDAGLRYMRVKVDENLHGAAINPVMDKGFDGDFDGDSVGLLKLTTNKAIREAHSKLSVAANMLDFGSVAKDGKYNFCINDGLDLKSVEFQNPELAKRYSELRDEANEIFVNKDGTIRTEVDISARQKVMRGLNDFVHTCFENGYGTDMLSYSDWRSHMATVEHTVVSGAKGSYGKLKDYAKYCGIEYNMRDLDPNDVLMDTEEREQWLSDCYNSLDDCQKYIMSTDKLECIDLDSIKDHGHSLATLEDDNAVQYATGTKSLGTGIAGMYSQRGIRALRNKCPKAVLELTYPVTQAILQVKHNPVAAAHMYDVMRGSARNLWQGYKLTKGCDNRGNTIWTTVRGQDGKPEQATPEEFVKQFVDMYTSEDGMNVSINPLYVKEVAAALTDPQTGRILSVDDSAVEKLASPMDRLAYEGNFDTVRKLAKEGANLYHGKENGFFAPYIILNNKMAEVENEKAGMVVKPLRPLVQKDTQAVKPVEPEVVLDSNSEKNSEPMVDMDSAKKMCNYVAQTQAEGGNTQPAADVEEESSLPKCS